jgi:hypothetical protein
MVDSLPLPSKPATLFAAAVEPLTCSRHALPHRRGADARRTSARTLPMPPRAAAAQRAHASKAARGARFGAPQCYNPCLLSPPPPPGPNPALPPAFARIPARPLSRGAGPTPAGRQPKGADPNSGASRPGPTRPGTTQSGRIAARRLGRDRQGRGAAWPERSKPAQWPAVDTRGPPDPPPDLWRLFRPAGGA